MNSPARRLLPALSGLLLLAGCGASEEKAAEKPRTDPALTGALADQIMVDPQLTGQNQANAAVSGDGSAAVELPPEARGPEAIAAAKGEAAKLAGGAIMAAPAATGGDADGLAEKAATAAQLAAASGSAHCAGKVEYAMAWANGLPQPLAIYPRGAVQEAAGTDSGECKLRVVNFVTPVAPDDIVNFYYTRARKSGFEAQHRMDGKDHVLGGNKGGAAWVVYARKLGNGLTEVDLVASGA